MTSEAISLDGQVAIVTGAGRGLGRAFAIEFGRRGAAVIVNDLIGNPEYGDHNQDHGCSTADRVVDAIVEGGGRAAAVYDSVATPAGGRAIVDAALTHFGRIDIVVHNAGNRQHARFQDLTPEQIDSVLSVHLRGAFWVTQPAWSLMQEQRYGRVVLISSGVGAFGMEGTSNYAAAKAGLIGLTRALALEGDAHGIRVNCVLPVANTAAENERPAGRAHAPELRERIAAVQPRDSRGKPSLVGPLVTYLSSRECLVNGRVFSAVAGRYAEAFTAVTRGWHSAGDESVCAEEIREHLAEITDRNEYRIPTSMVNELEIVAQSVIDVAKKG